jgi:hypothetical protein
LKVSIDDKPYGDYPVLALDAVPARVSSAGWSIPFVCGSTSVPGMGWHLACFALSRRGRDE